MMSNMSVVSAFVMLLGVGFFAGCGDPSSSANAQSGARDGATAASGQQAATGGVLDHRDAAIKACETGGDSERLCTCTFDEWAGGLQDPASASARAFLEIQLTPQGETPDQGTISTGMEQMTPYTEAMMACLQETGPRSEKAEQEQAAMPPSAPEADMRNEPAEVANTGDQASMNGVDVSTADARYAWYERELEGLDAIGVRDTPVPAFENLHKSYCMANRNDVALCACTWDALLTSLDGRDDVPARIAAYMSSVEPSDIPDVSAEERKTGGKLFADYLGTRACD